MWWCRSWWCKLVFGMSLVLLLIIQLGGVCKEWIRQSAVWCITYLTSPALLKVDEAARMEKSVMRLITVASVCSLISWKAHFLSSINQDFYTSGDGRLTRWTICWWCRVSLQKINITAVERHLQGGRGSMHECRSQRCGWGMSLLSNLAWSKPHTEKFQEDIVYLWIRDTAVPTNVTWMLC